MKLRIILLSLVFLGLTAMKSDKPAYQIFKQDGKDVKYKKLVKAALEADIVFFGELHNNPICHWLQLELTKDMYANKGSQLVLGAEMFESDNQLIIDEYMEGHIKQSSFEKEARLWPNYKTDYKPLFEFAKENNLPFIATNIPRRYASLVHKEGFEGLEKLEEASKAYISPLPVKYDAELKGYKAMLAMMGGSQHANPNLPKAQAIKDATMAHFILENWEPGKSFLHYNGTYHSNDFEGIVWYLKQEKPELNILTIASVEQDSIKKLDEESLDVADFILVIPSSMTKTY